MLLRAAVCALAYVGTARGFVMNLGPSNRRNAAKFALTGEPRQQPTKYVQQASLGSCLQKIPPHGCAVCWQWITGCLARSVEVIMYGTLDSSTAGHSTPQLA